jgi:hypothetical protein
VPLFAKSQREPFSRTGGPDDDTAETAEIIRGAAYTRLRSALEKYLRKRSSGRSFVISGNRGIGKSTMVLAVVEDLLGNSEREREAETTQLTERNRGRGREPAKNPHRLCRPLLVFLSGPDIIREQLRPAAPPALAPAVSVTVAPVPAAQATALLPAPPGAPPPTAPEIPPQVASSDNLLRQIARALHVSLSREFARRFEVTVASRDARPELIEAWAQLGLELSAGAKVPALRRFWDLGGKLEQGVLFQRPFEPDRQGLCELAALDASADAYRIAIGQVSEDNELTLDDNSREESSSWGEQLKTLAAPVAGLLGGAVTGLGVYQLPEGGPAKTWAALGAAVISALTLTFGLAPKRSVKAQAKSKFSPDWQVASLTWRLANVVDRLFRAGVAPVFVIDELDKALPKTEAQDDWLTKQAQELKCLLTERSFFCFLTGREFAEKLHVERAERTYPPSYTMFSEYLFINYLPLELHVYLRDRVRWELTTASSDDVHRDELQAAIFPFVVLFRAEMHPIDIRRELNALIGAGDELKLFSGASLPPADGFALLFQIAIESVLASEEVERRVRKDARFALLAMDAVYYAPRSWRVGSELDASEEMIDAYLRRRRGPEDKAPPDASKVAARSELEPLPPGDRGLLLSCATQVIDLIRQPQALSAVLEQPWFMKRFEAGDHPELKARLKALVEAALPRVSDLLEPKPGSDSILLWRYDADGLQIVADLGEVRRDVRRFHGLRTEVDNQLRAGLGFGVEQLEGEFCLLQHTTKWTAVSFLAASLKGARSVGPSAVQVRANAKALKDYVEVLTLALPRLLLASSICIVLEPAKPLSQSLPSLASTLDFPNLTDDARGARLTRVWAQLWSLIASAETPVAPDHDYGNFLTDWLKKIRAYPRPKPESVDTAFWDGWRKRLDAQVRGATDKGEPGWPDVAWQLARSGRPMLLAERYDATTASAWTQIVLSALSGKPASDEAIYPQVFAAFGLAMLRSPELAAKAAEMARNPDLASLFKRTAVTQERLRLIVIIASEQGERGAAEWAMSRKCVGLVVPQGMAPVLESNLSVLEAAGFDDSWIFVEAAASDPLISSEALLDKWPRLKERWPASRRAQLLPRAPKGAGVVAKAFGNFLTDSNRYVVAATSIDDALQKADDLLRPE